MMAQTRARLLGLLAVVGSSAGCWRADVYVITGTPLADGGSGDIADAPSADGSGGDIADAPSADDRGGDIADASPTDGRGGDIADAPPADGRGGDIADAPPADGGGDQSAESATCTSSVSPGKDTNMTLQVGSLSRSYVLHVPSAYDGKKPVPLILDFHGVGGTGASELVNSPYPDVTDAEGVVMAFPDGKKGPAGTAWNVGPCCVSEINGVPVDDVAFARALVADVQKIACIDPYRIYAVGILTGGGMAYYLACHAADVFAAVAPAAFDLLEENVDACKPSRAITEISFRGTAPSRVPYGGGDSSLVSGMPITFLGAVPTFERWAQIDGCSGSASQPDSKGCSTYSSCRDGVEVTLCTKDGGSEDPGDPTIAWPMLKRHPR
jgi:polyhydroxybutyrate depolymerase